MRIEILIRVVVIVCRRKKTNRVYTRGSAFPSGFGCDKYENALTYDDIISDI